MLSNKEIPQQIMKQIERVSEETKKGRIKEKIRPPFFYIDGSSGMGKTQLAFCFNRRPYYYLLGTSGGDGSYQHIYNNFISISQIFDECIEKDFASYGKHGFEYYSCNSRIYNLPLYTYGFILLLLKYNLQLNSNEMIFLEQNKAYFIKPTVQEEILNLLENEYYKKNKKIPFFIIDEVTTDKQTKTIFQRNIFRTVFLVVVLMGTDSKLTKMIPTSVHSRALGDREWVIVIPIFPKFYYDKSDNWKRIENKFPFLNDLIYHSRGLFSTLLIDYCCENETKLLDLRNNQLINVLLKYLFITIKRQKKLLFSVESKEAQTKLFLDSSRKRNREGENYLNINAIHKHFANLKDENLLKLFLDNESGKGESNYLMQENHKLWKPEALFPEIRNDILLYLIFLGTKDCYTLFDNDVRVPSLHMIQHYISDYEVYHQYEQKVNDGTKLEALCCMSICIASHTNGVEGISINNFITALVNEFQYDCKNEILLSEEPTELCHLLKELTIPFLSPPNGLWPSYLLSIPDTKFDNLIRPPNNERCDLLIENSEWFLGEVKDHNKLTTSCLKSMLKTQSMSHSTSFFRLYFTNKLQVTYFEKENGIPCMNNKLWLKFLKEEHLDNLFINIYKINCCNGMINELDSIHLPCYSSNECNLIIFIFYNLYHTQCKCQLQINKKPKN